MPSLAQARRGLALGSIAGLGIYRPPLDAPAAPRARGSDLTGVSNRVQADQGLSTPSLAAGAARAALRASGVDGADLEMIVVGTTTPDVLWPTTACLVQTELKLPMVASFDLYAAETSLLAALNVGIRYISAGARAVLLIGAESNNQLVDLPGQGGAVHGRAAAAAVLSRAGGDDGVLSTMAGGAAQPNGNGDAHDRILLRGLMEGATDCLRTASLTMADVDLVIGEQSAPEIMQAWSKLAGVSSSRLLLRPRLSGPRRSVLSVPPGATPLTRTAGASSCAMAVTRPRTANFDET
jgi:3-oxoacyl-[acyl-carrier-protein] synthase-3